MTLPYGTQVLHSQHGLGTLQVEQTDGLALVEFKGTILRVATTELRPLPSWEQALADPEWHNPLEVLAKAQAHAVRSLNRQWGVFSLSRIQLLPHQLWVCRKVTETWPSRWLVADDVGLGKTIEAGLILMSTFAHQRQCRFLVLCPASLTEQWAIRLREMFDLRTTVYDPALDKPNGHFWEDHSAVVASFHTLREDHKGRHARMLSSGTWDLVLVDEAHHYGAYEDGRTTKAYQLLQKMFDEKVVQSSVFFTGTPHKGNTYAFLSLLELLRPDLFDPDSPAEPQFPSLQHAMIRNNKVCATDLKGKRLFRGHRVRTLDYAYTDEEAAFYRRLTAFIEEGFLYAGQLEGNEQRAVGLVLKSMQKIASSSVAAIRKTLTKRLNRLSTNVIEIDRKQEILEQMSGQENVDLDVLSRLEEQISELSDEITVIENERPFLEELIGLADQVTDESKINMILETLQGDLTDRSVLFFTEYKATQALLVSALNQIYGDGCTGFINGDNRLEGVVTQAGKTKTISAARSDQADLFNAGSLRFLVSTEAAGEGIDLQRRCHTLIHVDVPWNPMRMHQRVGRLNRYGQENEVEVFTFLNPGTLENHIRGLLQAKISRINQALGAVMDDPEDMLQLVLGMEGSGFFDDLYSQGLRPSTDSSRTWFDAKTASFGSSDVISVVQSLLGNVAKFDFQSVSKEIPEVDLGDLIPFFKAILALQGRELMTSGEDFEFVTPEAWAQDYGIQDRYKKVRFDRNAPKTSVVFGLGTQVMEKALDDAERRPGSVSSLPQERWPKHVAVFRLFDRVTDAKATGHSRIVAIEQDGEGHRMMSDSELIHGINAMLKTPKALALSGRKAPTHRDACGQWLQGAAEKVQGSLEQLGRGFRSPGFEFIGGVFSSPPDRP